MKRPFKISAIIGIPLIVIGVLILVIGPSHSNDLAGGFKSPVIAFEFATQTEHVIQIFSETDSSARIDMMRKMTNSTQLDFLFLILYGAFLLTVSITCASLTGNRLYYLAALLSVVAPLFDVLENLQMFSIMEQLGTDTSVIELRYLHIFTWVKWGTLAVIFMLLIPFFRRAGKFGHFISIFAVIPVILAVLAFFKPGILNEIFSISIFVMFLLMIVFAFTYRENE